MCIRDSRKAVSARVAGQLPAAVAVLYHGTVLRDDGGQRIAHGRRGAVVIPESADRRRFREGRGGFHALRAVEINEIERRGKRSPFGIHTADCLLYTSRCV